MNVPAVLTGAGPGGVSISLSVAKCWTDSHSDGNGSFQRRRRNRFGINNFQMGQDLIEEHSNERPT